MTRHLRPWKEEQASAITKLADSHPVVAVADLNLFPAALFASIRKKLQGKAIIKVTKLRVARRGIEASQLKDSGLLDKMSGSVGLVFTEMNPFALYGFLKKNKGKVAAKPGNIAPEDIIVPAGDSGLPPGPALSDLKGAGLKVKVAGATIEITEDKVVTKAGEVISEPVASTLQKLDIKPMKVGMNLTGVLEGTQLYEAAVLDIDEVQVFQNFVTAHSHAFNVAMEIAYLTPETIPLLIAKAAQGSRAVALEGNILTKQTVGDILGKANRQASALNALIPATPTEPAKEEVKPEEPTAESAVEAKPEEPKAEESKVEDNPAEEKTEEPKGDS